MANYAEKVNKVILLGNFVTLFEVQEFENRGDSLNF